MEPTITISLKKAKELHSPGCSYCRSEIRAARKLKQTQMFRANVRGGSAWHVFSTREEAETLFNMHPKSPRTPTK